MSDRKLRILITNITLTGRTGTELYVRDLALGLLKRGHCPIVFSTDLGEIAEEIRKATVPVVSDLHQIAARPDLIHGHHNVETLAALLHFPTTPAIFYCHDDTAWHDRPPRFRRIIHYVCVDETRRDRMVLEYGIPEERVSILFNAVDLERFVPRAPLPPQPKTALVFSNNASESSFLEPIRAACARFNVQVDVVGEKAGTATDAPEKLLGHYDLVFAKGKAAMEAMVVGAAVVLCDSLGVGPMISVENLETLRRHNFGARHLQNPHNVNILAREIEHYDASDAAAVSRRLRQTVGLDQLLEDTLALYERVLNEAQERFVMSSAPADDLQASCVELREEMQQVADFLPLLSTQMRERALLFTQAMQWRADVLRLQADILGLQEDVSRSQMNASHLEEELRRYRRLRSLSRKMTTLWNRTFRR